MAEGNIYDVIFSSEAIDMSPIMMLFWITQIICSSRMGLSF